MATQAYRCTRCNHTFDVPDISLTPFVASSSVSYYVNTCPICGEAATPNYKCGICGCEVPELSLCSRKKRDGITEYMCQECADRLWRDPNVLY